MPLDAQRVAIAVAQGLSVVCATCEKYWTARDAGVPDDRCLAVDGCGSPIAGDSFHEYRGPMIQFDQFCFVCGNKSTHAVRVADSLRVIGCCGEHIGLVKKLKPKGKNAPSVVVISKDGERSTEEPEPEGPLVLKFRGN